MDWQLVGVGVAISAAVGYIAWATWKTWFGAKAGCGSECGKCAEPAPEPEPTGRIRLL